MEKTIEDYERHRMLSEEPIIRNTNAPPFIYNYMATDGKTFDNELECMMYDMEISRKRYYNHKIKTRNWFQKLFNIKPDMNFYDQMTLKSLWRKK